MRISFCNYASVSAIALCSAMPAQAQEARAPAHAAAAAADESGLGDIVVTARRREESLQEVPVAISAISAAALEEKGVRSVEDLRQAVPGLNISGQRRDEAGFYLRGQGPGIFNVGQRNFSSVATYFAEVPIEVAGPGTFFDLSSVQVLKGPQGTLFGRNTTGGAVLFEPQRPTFDIEGYAKVSIGNYAAREVEAVLNIPMIADVLSIRLAGNVAERDGYTQSIITGQKLDARDYRAYRVSVLFTPFAGLENLTIVDGRDKDQDGTSAILRQYNPASPLAATFAPLMAQQNAIGIRKTLIPELIFERQRTVGVTNKTSWEISNDITLKNIVSFRRSRGNRGSDYDGTPVETFQIENAPIGRKWQYGQEQFTEEFQIQGKIPAAGLDYIVGYYHELSKPGFPQEIRQRVFGGVTVRNLDSHDQSDAVFAHAELAIADQLQLSGGFRYTWDKRRASISVFNAAGACTQVTCPFDARANFKAPTYDATLQYKVTDDALVYAAYRHGYKSGGVNLPSPVAALTKFNPEYVDEIEIGLKADWNIGIPLRTNISAFLDKYKDIQITSPAAIPGVGIISLVQNSAKATNKGVEFEGTIVPVEHLSISGFLSYLDAHSDVTVPGTAAVKGRQTAFQPKWKYGVSGRFDVPMDDAIGRLAVSADYSWQSRTNTNETNPTLITTYPSYGLLNARIELTDIAGKGVDFALFGSNLTQKTYILGGFPLGGALGYESSIYGEPRMYGASLKVRFGN
ncbi:TonB-dependent receptor [Sphingomonas sp. KC8]|nr:TonB-dependent receptor [Sphingomonas sp. KC8]